MEHAVAMATLIAFTDKLLPSRPVNLLVILSHTLFEVLCSESIKFLSLLPDLGHGFTSYKKG
jgi:hypothetical protein